MRRHADRGAITVHAAAVAALLVVAALLLTEMAGLVRLRHRVAAAADLAALAASQASVRGDEACPVARQVADRNDASVLVCRMDYDVATITARGTSRTWWGHRWAFEQKARAVPDYYVSK